MPSPARAGSTPGRSMGRSSKGSSGLVFVEETPKATPTHRYNEWATNRKDESWRREKEEDLADPDLTAEERSMKRAWDEDEREDERRYDRDWYDTEEDSAAADESSAEGKFIGDEERWEKLEAELKKKLTRRDGSKMSLATSKKLSQMHADNNAWEENRLLTSGVVRQTEVDMDFDNEDENRVQLLVHDTKPPFLDGRVVFTTQMKPVLPVKDPTSDLATIAKKGSKLVMEMRSKRDENKSRERFWELAGTKMGAAMGVEKTEEEKTEEEKEREKERDGEPTKMAEDGEVDYKESSRFAEHMKEESVAVSDFAKTKTMQEQRQYLPIYDIHEELMSIIREFNVVVVVGETGSGKTTQMTQYMHEAGYTTYGMVGCTQPRRVAAMSVAKRVSEEMDCELGGKVGYAIRFEDCTGPETIIKYMTDGVLLRETLREGDLDSYSCVIMDEAHERSLHTDVLFGILKKVVARRRDFKLIVTSATLNAKKFSDFFGSVPIYTIPGRTFPVEVLYSRTPQEDYVDAAVKQAITIHLGAPTGDILIFMTGQEEIETVCFAMK
eukprot:gene18602-22213_t